MKYKMKFYGSVDGKVSGLTRHFDKDQIIDAPEGEFDETSAEILDEKAGKDLEEKKEAQITEGKKAETASFKSPGKKR